MHILKASQVRHCVDSDYNIAEDKGGKAPELLRGAQIPIDISSNCLARGVKHMLHVR
jgi:hypothetical protein